MYKPVKKIATTFARPVEWARFSSFRTDAIYVPVDRCQTQTTFSPVDGKVSVQETVTVKKELAPVENDLAPVKIEPVQKKAYRPKKTLRYSKKNMTPEQIQDYYYARQVQIKENFNLRSRALSPCSQFRDRTYAECPVTTDAIPSGRRTRQYRVTHELAKLIGVTKGSNPELDKVDSSFHPFSVSINEYQDCLELKTRHFALD
ncbi:uncharacterized protein TNCV_3829031 [Trichonephila clavipes]|nr:uncharacterized protein TNCV_3829031 [Trichonephila clavipes]